MLKKDISSKDNPTFKYLKKLTTSSGFREREQKFWVEGKKVIKNFLLNCDDIYDITEVISKSKFENSYKKINKNKLFIIDDNLFDELSQINSDDQMALVIKRNEKNSSYKNINEVSSNVVLLNEIQDPGNLGTVIRTCAAFGIRNIWVTKSTVDLWSPKVIRASVGCNVFIDFMKFVDLQEALNYGESKKFKLIATSLDKESKNFYSINFNKYKKKLFIFGNEGKGLPINFLNRENLLKFKIPHENFVESFNVASAVAICLSEVTRQNKLI